MLPLFNNFLDQNASKALHLFGQNESATAPSSTADITGFQRHVLRLFHHYGRPFPWRDTRDPYKVLVSEIMLQQTQTARVIPKYQAFLAKYPTVDTLADSSLADVLTLWQGLGYNRRGRNLRLAAQAIATDFGGVVPDHEKALRTLPGIGQYTARAVLVFAFGQPHALIETNIRAVVLHHFFDSDQIVSDAEVLEIVTSSIVTENPRDWFYALMDYGVTLKKEIPGVGRNSAQYRRQSKFAGSERQMRGAIVRALTSSAQNDMRLEELENTLNAESDPRFYRNLAALCKEEMVSAVQSRSDPFLTVRLAR